jgi:hypothetical protein
MMTLALLTALLCQDEIRNDVVTRLDEQGDAQMEITFTLSASQWLKWKANVGDHPDLMKRDMIRSHSTSVVEVNKLDLQAMDGKAVATLTSRGEARYKGAGRYELTLPAAWQKAADTGNEWVFSHSEVAGQGLMMKQIHKIVLPKSATNVKLKGPADGQQILTYEVPAKGGFNPLIIFSVIGFVLLVFVTVVRFTAGSGAPGAQPVKA